MNPPETDKLAIRRFIQCKNYDKAEAKIEKTMEPILNRLASVKKDIQAQQSIIDKAKYETTYYLGGPSDNNQVAKHNTWVRRGEAAVDKHNDLVDRQRDLIDRANERREELTTAALLALDDDIVVVLDSLVQVADKLANSTDASGDLAAIEVCFIGMKIHHFFNDLVEQNTARQAAQRAHQELQRIFASVIGEDAGKNHVTRYFQRDAYLVQNNQQIYQQFLKVLETVDRKSLHKYVDQLQRSISRHFDAVYEYDGIVDPTELEVVAGQVRNGINDVDAYCATVEWQVSDCTAVSKTALEIHNGAAALVATMVDGVDGLAGDPLGPDHFMCQIMDQEVVDDFFGRELRPAVTALREHLAETLGEAVLDQILTETADVYYVERAARAISEADLQLLEALRKKAPLVITRALDVKKRLENHLEMIAEVPRENADRFAKELGWKYIFSLVPLVGLVPAGAVLRRVGSFEEGFSSTNEIYQDLAQKTASKNRIMAILHFVIGSGFGVAAVVAAIVAAVGASGISASGGSLVSGGVIALALGVGGSGGYLITALLLFMAGRRLTGYGAIASGRVNMNETNSVNSLANPVPGTR